MADNYNYGTLYAVSNSPLTAAMCSRIRQAMQKTNSWLSNYLLEAQVDPSLPSDYISLRAREYNICSPSSYLIRELPATKDSIDTTINILRFSIQDDPLSEIPTLFARERREPKMPRRRRVTTGNMPLRDIVCAARHAPEPCCYDESILAEERCYAQKEFEIEEEIDTEEEEELT
ncbi:MAG: hypothetical protein IK092_00055, partial [Muribaculaceae bacterium]|nr:hypothetical protein [Muribaculaceae bacterium]